MSQPLNIGMPQVQDIGATYTIRVTAIDPSSGATVAGVNVTTAVLDVFTINPNLGDLSTGNWFLVPGPVNTNVPQPQGPGTNP